MTDADKAAEALALVRRNSRWERTTRAILMLYLAVVATASLIVVLVSLKNQLNNQADNSAKARAMLQIIKAATDPNSQIAQRGQQQTAQAVNQIGSLFDATTKQRVEELLQAVRTGQPIVFGPAPTLPPTSTSTTTAPRGTAAPKG